MVTIVALVICYLIGSASSAIIISRMLNLSDPRQAGSGNAGATNVLRLSGKKVAGLVLLCDVLKGMVAVYLSWSLGIEGWMLGIAAIAVVLGHIFPIFFSFKGGKGVATAAGAILAISFWVGLLVAATWIIVAVVWRYSSLASLIAAAATPFYMLVLQHSNFFLPTLLLALIIAWRHLDNIQRLRTGTEKKIYLHANIESSTEQQHKPPHNDQQHAHKAPQSKAKSADKNPSQEQPKDD